MRQLTALLVLKKLGELRSRNYSVGSPASVYSEGVAGNMRSPIGT